MFSLLLAIAAASQTPKVPEPTPTPAQYTAADYCADYGDFAYVIMEDVKKGRDAGQMLVSAQKAETEAGRDILTELVYSAFEMNRVTQGAMTPKRFSDDAVLECYKQIKEKERVSNQNP